MQDSDLRWNEGAVVDPGNSLTFSCWPQPPEDPAEVALEIVCRHVMLSSDQKQSVGDQIRAAFVELGGVEQRAPSDAREESVAELLHMFSSAENGRLLAHVMLMLINRNPYSEVQVARMLGVTKAAVSKVKTDLQDRLNLTPRIGRSPAARKTFSILCKTRHQRKKPTEETWSGLKILNCAISPAR